MLIRYGKVRPISKWFYLSFMALYYFYGACTTSTTVTSTCIIFLHCVNVCIKPMLTGSAIIMKKICVILYLNDNLEEPRNAL